VDTAGTTEARRTILLVEDDRSIRTFTTRVLRRAGFRVVTADSGDAALAAFARYRGQVDLLLTDVLMPGMSGAELAERIRVDRPELPVLFVSGFPADLATGERLVPQGGALLAKPFTGVELVERVRLALDGAEPGAA
jgi:DNA-binding response OmpR family regulator